MYNTEYTDNFCKPGDTGFHGQTSSSFENGLPSNGNISGKFTTDAEYAQALALLGNRPDFVSEQFSSVYRDTKLPKHPDGKWRFPCDTVATKPYGRRLMYDATHPDAMYASQWSSELADPPGPYSFATTTGLPAELPWTKDLSWQVNGEQGHWPTELWRRWTLEAVCPPYDGHTDQPAYSQYKVHTDHITGTGMLPTNALLQ